MKIKNAILICLFSITATSLFAAFPTHIQYLSHTAHVDTALHTNKLALDMVTVSDIGNCSNLLEWTTLAEKNCYSFVIMKSVDNFNYTSIGSVLGNGTTNESHQYDFVDDHASPNNYYRIDQFDYKGGVISSEILIMSSTCGHNLPATIIEEIYPNPLLENELAIRVYQNSKTAEMVQLTDQFGKVIMEKNIQLNRGKNILRLNINKITSGTYFIKVGSASEKFSK